MNTEIQGNLAVTRSINIGGNATMQGNAKVVGNLRIEGWLDAPNVKSPCKGLFHSAAELGDAYPLPRPGWWALVGNSIPARIFKSDGEKWVDTGADGGTTDIDLHSYDTAIEGIRTEIGEIEDDLQQINDEMQDMSERIDSVPHPVETVNTTNADLVIADENQTPIVTFKDGHIRTALFDSARVNTDMSKSSARLRYLHWNVGHWAKGNATQSAINASTYETTKKDFRQLFNHYGADIVGMVEYSEIFYEQETAQDAILCQYPHLYMAPTQSGYIGVAWASAMSIDQRVEFQVGNGYTAYEGIITAGMKQITICEVHTPWQSAEMCINAHQLLIDRYADTRYVIVAGDMNVVRGTETTIQQMWQNAGYEMANWGYLGNINTQYNGEHCVNYLDNIFVKGGTIVHTEVLQNTPEGCDPDNPLLSDETLWDEVNLSDHFPLISDIIF